MGASFMPSIGWVWAIAVFIASSAMTPTLVAHATPGVYADCTNLHARKIAFDVNRAYMRVLLADEAVEVARASVQRTEQNLRSVRLLRYHHKFVLTVLLLFS